MSKFMADEYNCEHGAMSKFKVLILCARAVFACDCHRPSEAKTRNRDASG